MSREMTSPSPASAEPISAADREKAKRWDELREQFRENYSFGIHNGTVDHYEMLGLIAEAERTIGLRARVVELETALAEYRCPLGMENGSGNCSAGSCPECVAARLEGVTLALAAAENRSETVHEANKRLIATLVASEARATAAEAERDETFTDDAGTVWSRPTAWAYYAAVKALHEHDARATALLEALERIGRWFGEFPPSDAVWPDGAPMSYGAAYGSNGERDYMREVANAAIREYGASNDRK